MPSLTAILQLIDMAQGESSYGAFGNWGDVADENFKRLEAVLGEVSTKALTSGDVTLSAVEERSLLIKLTGTLTANAAVLTNDRKGFWFVSNDTTGDFNVTFRTTSGSGVVVPQGTRCILVSDGTNIYRMTSAGANGSAPKPSVGSKAANYQAVQSDDGSLIEFTAAATLSFKAAAILGAGWYCTVKAGSGDVVLDPNSTELVNGVATLTVPDGASAVVFCTGTAFRAILGAAAPFDTAKALFVDTSDATKKLRFAIAGFTTATMRTVTWPNVSGTVLVTTADANLEAGFTSTEDDDGTIVSGNYTPTPSGGNYKKIIAGGPIQFLPPVAAGSYQLVVQVTNASGAVVTPSGFSATGGENWDNTVGRVFNFYITKVGTRTHLVIARA